MRMNNKLMMMSILLTLFKNSLQEIAKLMLGSIPEAHLITFSLIIWKNLKREWKNQNHSHHKMLLFPLISVSSISEKSKDCKKETNGTVLNVRSINKLTSNSVFTRHPKSWSYTWKGSSKKESWGKKKINLR